MTKEAFINKWLGNPSKQYIDKYRDEMREDLDKVIKTENILRYRIQCLPPIPDNRTF